MCVCVFFSITGKGGWDEDLHDFIVGNANDQLSDLELEFSEVNSLPDQRSRNKYYSDVTNVVPADGIVSLSHLRVGYNICH